jgi:hypothetical protein
MRDPPQLPPDLLKSFPLLVSDDADAEAFRNEVREEVDAWLRAKARIRRRFEELFRQAQARREAEGK